MPCMCWYEPSNADKSDIKHHCVELVRIVKRLHKNGDPIGCTLYDVKKLLDHLYSGECDERPTPC